MKNVSYPINKVFTLGKYKVIMSQQSQFEIVKIDVFVDNLTVDNMAIYNYLQAEGFISNDFLEAC